MTALARQEDATRGWLSVLGATPDLAWGEKICCVLPGHEENRPSASIYRKDKGGIFRYCDWHCRNFGIDPQWYLLAEVHAARRMGQSPRAFQRLSLTESHTVTPLVRFFTLDMYEMAGQIQMVEGILPELRREFASPTLVCVYHAVARIFGLKWLVAPNEPTALDWKLIASLADLPVKDVAQEMPKLLRAGIIKFAGTCRSRFGREMAVFMPGDGNSELDTEEVEMKRFGKSDRLVHHRRSRGRAGKRETDEAHKREAEAFSAFIHSKEDGNG